MSTSATATQELASVLLGEDVVAYVLRARRQGVHWRQIVADLAEKTGGRVQITERSLQLWTRDQRDAEELAEHQARHPRLTAHENPVDAEIRAVNEWVAEQREMAAAR